MDLTKELLAGASFRAKGKWYAAQQVDAFLEELSVRLEEDSREREELGGRRPGPPAGERPPPGGAGRRQSRPAGGSTPPRGPAAAGVPRFGAGAGQPAPGHQGAAALPGELPPRPVEEDAQSLLRQVEGLPSEKLL